MIMDNSPSIIIEYHDPEEHFRGWMVRDTLRHRICAGGLRVQKGLSRDHLIKMARNMTLKMQINNLCVDGAKCGIDYDPSSPGKKSAVRRFLLALKPYITTSYSLGPDLNIEMDELESAGRDIGIPSVKMAIAEAQGWSLDYFLERSSVLTMDMNGWNLSRIRAGYGVAMAAMAAVEALGIPPSSARIAIQGFGSLAKSAAYGIIKSGPNIIAFCDAETCVTAHDNLNTPSLLKIGETRLPRDGYNHDVTVSGRESITDVPCDILIPAAVENTITDSIAERLEVKAVIPGANLAVSPSAEEILHRRGILVLPDFLAGSGGSISMEGLYAPEHHPTPQDVLGHIEKRMKYLVKKVIQNSRSEGTPPRITALKICSESHLPGDQKPYGFRIAE